MNFKFVCLFFLAVSFGYLRREKLSRCSEAVWCHECSGRKVCRTSMWGAGSEWFLRAPALCATEMALCQFQVGQVEPMNQQGLRANHIHRSGTQNLGCGPYAEHSELGWHPCSLENPPQAASCASPAPPQASGYPFFHSSSLLYYISSIWRRPAKKGGAGWGITISL